MLPLGHFYLNEYSSTKDCVFIRGMRTIMKLYKLLKMRMLLSLVMSLLWAFQMKGVTYVDYDGVFVGEGFELDYHAGHVYRPWDGDGEPVATILKCRIIDPLVFTGKVSIPEVVSNLSARSMYKEHFVTDIRGDAFSDCAETVTSITVPSAFPWSSLRGLDFESYKNLRFILFDGKPKVFGAWEYWPGYNCPYPFEPTPPSRY